ncbi:MAG TPA: hypothetical protein VFX15_13330, partial [Actinomycetes bacterium]|nr:hypothetical protein [Actinomycetes bacterium]
MEWSTAARGFQRHWLVITLCVLLLAAGTVAIASFMKERYEATSVMAVEPTSTEVSTQLLSYLIPGIEAQTVGGNVETAVRAGLDGGASEADWSVSTDVEAGAGVLRVNVSSEDPDVPVPVANEYASYLTSSDIGTSALTITTIDPAVIAEPTPEKQIALIAGVGLTLLVPLLLCFVLGARDERGRMLAFV